MRRIATLGSLLLLLLVSRAAAAQEGWELRLGAEVAAAGGYVQVRENGIEGTKLDLSRDLGARTLEVVSLSAARRLRNGHVLRVDLEDLLLNGSTTLSRDVFFNGTTLAGGTALTTRPLFLRIAARYEAPLARIAPRGTLRGDAGVTYALLDFRLHGTLTPESRGTETKEDFLTQELPVPTLGLTLEEAISPRTTFRARIAAGWLPKVNSLRAEGGEVLLSQTELDATAAAVVRLAGPLRLEAGGRLRQFFQREISREDDNDLHWRSAGAFAALAARFP